MVRVHGNALKHGLTSEEVAYAWENPIRCRQRNGTDDPPLWISVGSLPDGRFAELIGFMDIDGVWCVFFPVSNCGSFRFPLDNLLLYRYTNYKLEGSKRPPS